MRPVRQVGACGGAAQLYLPGFLVNHSLRLSGFAAWSFKQGCYVFGMPVRGLGYGYPARATETTKRWSAAVDCVSDSLP